MPMFLQILGHSPLPVGSCGHPTAQYDNVALRHSGLQRARNWCAATRPSSWTIPIEFVDREGGLIFRVSAVQGRACLPFVYLTWGDGRRDGLVSTMFRRATLMRRRPRAADHRRQCQTRVATCDLTRDCGGPRCARCVPTPVAAASPSRFSPVPSSLGLRDTVDTSGRPSIQTARARSAPLLKNRKPTRGPSDKPDVSSPGVNHRTGLLDRTGSIQLSLHGIPRLNKIGLGLARQCLLALGVSATSLTTSIPVLHLCSPQTTQLRHCPPSRRRRSRTRGCRDCGCVEPPPGGAEHHPLRPPRPAKRSATLRPSRGLQRNRRMLSTSTIVALTIAADPHRAE